MELKKFLLSFNNLNTYLFMAIMLLMSLIIYFYVINPL
ncbi:hypothetical protein [Acinetobacter sp. B51(2017)]|nr:hypothetical protein [Acinetobacter sp. B51(2017)]